MTPDERLKLADEQIAAAQSVLKGATAARSQAMKEKWPTKCCRCWPSSINKAGYCGCCDFNHVTGKSEATHKDPTPEVS